MEARELRAAALKRFLTGVIIQGAIFFGPPWTFRYWEAWVFMAVLFIPAGFAVSYLIANDPALLERRLKMREERERQKTIQKVASVIFLLCLLLPPIDHRFGWSSVPATIVIVSNALVLIGYLYVLRTFKENSYAHRTIRVEEGQEVITTGPYAMIRHPMYLGVTVMMFFTPLALGSYWALIPALVTPVALVFRIRDEEAALLEELPGYREYTKRTRYRIIPGIW